MQPRQGRTVSGLDREAANMTHQIPHGAPYFVIQCFDREGYHSSCLARTESEARDMARSKDAKFYIAFSTPFAGAWAADGRTPDITMPPEFKEALASINRSAGED